MKRICPERSTTPLLFALLLASASSATSQDWPQWGGPSRDFSTRGGPLHPNWEGERPEELWRVELGGGRSAITVVGDTLFTLFGGRLREAIVALDADTGERRWQHDYEVSYQPHAYDGPHATPAAAEGRLVGVSIDAQIQALELETGRRLWIRDLVAELGLELPQFGYAASPLIHDGLVLLPGLGGPGRGALALRLADGATVWARHDFRSSHASPILIRHRGRLHAVFHGMDWLYGLDPASGELLWRFRLRRDAFDNVSFTPLWDEARGHVIVSHGYDDFGASAVAPGASGEPRRVWQNPRLNVDHGNGVLLDDVLYASHKSNPSFLVAIDIDRGRLLWRVRMPKTTLVAIGDRLLLLDEDGVLSLAQPTSEGPNVVGRMEVLERRAWTVPTPVGKRLYLRDNSDLVALRLP